MRKTEILAMKNELSIRSKNGIAFLLSGTVIWIMITIIHFQSINIQQKNIFLLFATSIMFPLSILLSKIIRAEWRVNDNPLSELGLYLNIAQLVYFPLVFLAFVQNPQQMVLFFAIITGAHFFPYGWFYNATPYYMMAPIISVFITIIGSSVSPSQLWIIPSSMVILLILLMCWLYVDYRKKVYM